MTGTIVNRTPTTPHLTAELEKLYQAEKEDQAAALEKHEDVSVEFGKPDVEVLENPDLVTPSPSESIAALAQGVPLLERFTPNREFEKFKQEVIAAFKHLGLDTRKHFS